MYKLETKQVNVFLKDKQLLKDVSVSLNEHCITACIGKPGCGKDIFLRLFNRMNETPDSEIRTEGEIFIDRRLVSEFDLNLLRKKVGMVFSEPNPFPDSILENVTFGLKVYGVRHKRYISEVVERSLRQVSLWEELKDILHKPAARLSKGKQQLLCLARVLAMEPSVLLMDEPTSSLDLASAYKMEEIIYSLKSKFTILISTSTIQQASKLSDHTAFFSSGELIEFGETSRIFTNPVIPKTLDYITGKSTE